MNLKEFLQLPENHFTAGQIARWLWRALKGNRLQAVLNASIGLMGVVLSLASVWAMQRAIDTASGVREGSIYWAVGIMAALILGEFALGISRVWVNGHRTACSNGCWPGCYAQSGEVGRPCTAATLSTVWSRTFVRW